jgi:hypothetical protein
MTSEISRMKSNGDVGLIIIKRLHRMVRCGFRPRLGYSATSGEDEDIHLRRCGVYRGREEVASISPDGTVSFVFKVLLVQPRADPYGNLHSEAYAIFVDDAENFDALFPAESPPQRHGRFVRWLYDNIC